MKTASVEDVANAVRAGQWREALDLALPLWRASRDATLHRLIIALGQQIDQTVKPLVGSKPDIVKKQLRLALAKMKDHTLLGRLLEPNPIGNWADRHRLMEALAAWPPDPRIGAHALVLAKSFSRDHMTMPSYFPPLRDVLLQHADTVIADAASQKRSNLSRSEAKSLTNALKNAVPLDADARSKIDAVLKAVEAPAASADEATLLERIHERPDDDAARAVYADALTARGDPRGEFIALQLAPKLTTAQRQRMRSLLEKHEKTWSGPLVLVLERRVYERGFLAAGAVLPAYEVTNFHARAPEWRTLERLENATTSIGRQFSQLVELETGDPLKGAFPRLKSLSVENIAQLDKAELPTLESLQVSNAPIAKLKAFLTRPTSSSLKSLIVGADDMGKVAALPLPAALTRLGSSSTTTMVRDGDAWRLELRAGANGYSSSGSSLAAFEKQPLTGISFVGTWNRFAPRKLADAAGPKLAKMINAFIEQSGGKFLF